jgi:hypothetical protein
VASFEPAAMAASVREASHRPAAGSGTD